MRFSGAVATQVALFSLFQVCTMAQAPNFYGMRVLRVEYVPDRQPLLADDLEAAQAVKAGNALSEEAVGQTIDQLFATGYYKDIQVDAEPASGGVVLRVVTELNTFVGHLDVQGKIITPPNEGQIRSLTQLNLGTPFDPGILTAAKKSIEDLLKNNGLYESTVTLESEKEPETQQVNVTLTIDPGKRARYSSPIIEGDTKLSDSTIIRATGWRYPIIHIWKQVTESLTRKGLDGIQKKYQGKDRLTATVDLQGMDYNPSTRRLQPKLKINAGPKIEVKTLETKVSKRKLTRYIPIYQEGAVDRDLLVEGAANLRNYFQSQGYPDVDVTFRQLPPENDKQTIEYFIAKGARQKLADVEIRGNKYFRTETIRERMLLAPSSFQFRHGRYSEAYRQRDEDTIANLYKANGFRNIKVSSKVEDNYKGKANQLAVTFDITEGQQWYVSKLYLSGVGDAQKETIENRLSSSQGQPYSDLSVSTDRNAILTYYYTHGFRKANFRFSATPSDVPNHMDLHYEVAPGPQDFVRDVIISGLSTTRPSLIEKNIFIKPGDPLSPAQISEGQQKLYNLGIFAQINSAIQNQDGTAAHKYVLYDFDEAKRYTINVGFGAEIAQFGPTANTLQSPAGSQGFSPRVSFDVSRLNFLGLAHTISLRTRVSNIQQRAALTYLAPSLQNVEGRDLTVSGLYDVSRDVRTFASRRQEASIQLSNRLSKPTTVYVRFAYRRVSTSNVVIPTLLVPQLLQPVRIGMLSGNLVQDRRDNPADAHRGIYNTVDIGLASKAFGSQRTFGRVLLRNATYTPIGKKLVFARQIEFGLVQPFHIPKGLTESEVIPLPERFFGGGSISHRGFPENQAGPRDIGTPQGPGAPASQPTGFPLGGNAILFSNLELRFPLLGENIGGVIFEDAGNIYSRISDISFRLRQPSIREFNYMVHAVGFGIRYKTPIGPVRVDLAYSINPPSFVGFKGDINDLLSCNPNLPLEQLPSVCQGVRQNTGHVQFFFSIGQTF